MFVLYFWKCRENPLTPPRKKKQQQKKTQTAKESALNYIDVLICLGEGRKIEMPAREESKGLEKRASSEGTLRFAPQSKTAPPKPQKQAQPVYNSPSLPSACLRQSAGADACAAWMLCPEAIFSRFV